MIADRKEVKVGDIWGIRAKTFDNKVGDSYFYIHYLILSSEHLKQETGSYGWDVLCLESGKSGFSNGIVGIWERVA